MSIATHYRVTVDLEKGIDILYEIETRTELDAEFEKDFIKATNKSFNAQTDGYNGNVFADFESLSDAEEAEGMLIEIGVKWETIVKNTLEKEEREFNEEE